MCGITDQPTQNPPKVKGILASIKVVDKVVMSALIQVYGRGVRNFDADGFEHGSRSRGGGLKVDLSNLPTEDDEGVSMQNRASALRHVVCSPVGHV